MCFFRVIISPRIAHFIGGAYFFGPPSLDRIPSKIKDPSLKCYLIHSQGKYILLYFPLRTCISFSRLTGRKYTAESRTRLADFAFPLLLYYLHVPTKETSRSRVIIYLLVNPFYIIITLKVCSQIFFKIQFYFLLSYQYFAPEFYDL